MLRAEYPTPNDRPRDRYSPRFGKKNVHALVCDVNLIKRGLAVSETTIVELRQMVNGINVQLKTLLQENRKVKNDSIISKTKMMAHDLKLRTVNHSVSTLYKRLSVIQRDSEEKKTGTY